MYTRPLVYMTTTRREPVGGRVGSSMTSRLGCAFIPTTLRSSLFASTLQNCDNASKLRNVVWNHDCRAGSGEELNFAALAVRLKFKNASPFCVPAPWKWRCPYQALTARSSVSRPQPPYLTRSHCRSCRAAGKQETGGSCKIVRKTRRGSAFL